jgi:hypothetical protein
MAAGGQLTPNLVVIGGLRTEIRIVSVFSPPPALLNFGLSFRPVLGPILLANEGSPARWQMKEAAD